MQVEDKPRSNFSALPKEMKPRERMFEVGPENLSDQELLAILLRTGYKGKSVMQMAEDLLVSGNGLGGLSDNSLQALSKIKGIKNEKATTLAAAFELSRRLLTKKRHIYDIPFTSPKTVAEYFISRFRDKLAEEFHVVLLNSNNLIKKDVCISRGNLDTSVVHPREVFKAAIDNLAKSIILVHNHPSGNTMPSNSDIQTTKKIVESGKILEIPVLDHIIIGGNSYSSFVELGHI